jgi:hypothetical protein
MARELLGLATGAESEAVKLNAIRDALDRAGMPAKAEVSVEVKPWERLMGDIAGIATISRDKHHSRQAPMALAKPADAEVIDAELVDPDAEGGPESRSSSSDDAMRYPEAGDVPDGDMPPGNGGLMTLEDAAEANRAAARMHRLKRRR